MTFVLTLVVASPALARDSSHAVFLGADPMAVREVKHPLHLDEKG